MSITMDYTTQDAAETVDDFVYPIEEFSNLPARKPEAGADPCHRSAR
jgi:hypothetical protein